MRGPQTPDELNSILVGHTLELHGARSHADCTVRFLGLNLLVGKCGVETIPEGKKLGVRPRYLRAPADSPEKIRDALNQLLRHVAIRDAAQLCQEERVVEAVEMVEVRTPRGSLVPKSLSLFGSTASPEWASAARNGRLDVVEAVLERGQKVDARTSQYGRTALWLASDGGHVSVVARLLAANADATRCDVGVEDDAPLHRAAYRGHPEVVRLLLAAGAAPYQRNASGRTPLDFTNVIAGKGQAEARAILEESAGTGVVFVQDTPQTTCMFGDIGDMEFAEPQASSPALLRARAKLAGERGCKKYQVAPAPAEPAGNRRDVNGYDI
jgi:hypothetical protein